MLKVSTRTLQMVNKCLISEIYCLLHGFANCLSSDFSEPDTLFLSFLAGFGGSVSRCASESKSKHQQQALTNILLPRDVFYASDAVLPGDFYDMRSCLVLLDVSYRNDDRETGEFCSHEGRHRRFPAAPSASPVQLPISTTHAVRPHPAQGQGALHLQVRAGARPSPRRGGSPGRVQPWEGAAPAGKLRQAPARSRAASRGHLHGLGGGGRKNKQQQN